MFRFSNRSKIFILFLLSLFVFIPISEAKSEDPDPCNNISGNWKGKGVDAFPAGQCSWDADVKFEKYANTIRMNYNYANNGCDGPKEGSFVRIGTCKDALITFNDSKGTIFGNAIYMKFYGYFGSYTETNLVKQ